jgi:hypothetical protein
LVVATFPAGLILIAGIGALVGILVGFLAVLGGDWVWAKGALSIGGTLFFISLFQHTLSETFTPNLPVLLLDYMMILFCVEILSATCRHNQLYSKLSNDAACVENIVLLQKALRQIYGKLARLATIFGTSYLLTIGVLLVSGMLASFASALADISLYVIAISISLVILVLLREEPPES